MCPFSSLAFLQLTTVDKEPTKLNPLPLLKVKKTGDFSPVMIQLFKIKPIHRFRLQYNHLQ